MIDRGIKANTSGFMINKEIQFGISRVLEAMKEPEEKYGTPHETIKVVKAAKELNEFLAKNIDKITKGLNKIDKPDPIQEVYNKWERFEKSYDSPALKLPGSLLVEIFKDMWKAIENYCKGE